MSFCRDARSLMPHPVAFECLLLNLSYRCHRGPDRPAMPPRHAFLRPSMTLGLQSTDRSCRHMASAAPIARMLDRLEVRAPLGAENWIWGFAGRRAAKGSQHRRVPSILWFQLRLGYELERISLGDRIASSRSETPYWWNVPHRSL